MNPYFCCHNRYSNAMEGCVEKVNALFVEEYVLFMIQERLYAEGEQKKILEEMAENVFAVLSKEMLDEYIEKIIVYDEQNIEICWKEDKEGK